MCNSDSILSNQYDLDDSKLLFYFIFFLMCIFSKYLLAEQRNLHHSKYSFLHFSGMFFVYYLNLIPEKVS